MFQRKAGKLERAIYGLDHDYLRSPLRFTKTISAAIRSAVRATHPGRQQKVNLDPLVAKAETAFIRTLRRRSGK